MIGQSEPATDANALPDGAASAPDDMRVEDTPLVDTPVEIGGRKGPDPVRYGDWEKNGRCIDF